MRIRKNLKLFSTSSSSSPSSSSSKDDTFHPDSNDATFDPHSKDATFHPHMCQLNPSPWDLIPFSSESMYQQFECDDNSFSVTTTRVDANVAINSDSTNSDSIIATNCDSIAHGVEKHNIASVMEIDEQEIMKLRVDEAVMAFMMLVNYAKESPTKAAGNANNEIMAENAINKNNNYGGNNKKPLITTSTIPVKGRRSNNRKPRAVITFKEPVGVVKRTPSSSKTPSKNLHDFYYYSGFGPTWNTKRRGQREVKDNNVGLENSSALQGLQRNVGIKNISTTTTPSETTIENGNNSSTTEKNVGGFNYDLDLNMIFDNDKDKEKDKGNYGKNKRMK